MLNSIANRAYQNYKSTTAEIQETMQLLAEGKPKLNPADKTRVLKMNSRINTLRTANVNVKESLNLIRSADSGINSIRSVVSKLRSIAQEAQSEEISAEERADLQVEYDTLYKEIDFVLDNTEYDGVKLLDGTFGSRNVVIDSDDTVQIDIGEMSEGALHVGAYTKVLQSGDPEIGQDNGNGGTYAEGDSVNIVKTSVSSVENAKDAVERLDFALGKLDQESTKLNAKAQRFEFTTSHLTSMVGILEESVDVIEDFDEAREMSRLAQAQIRQQSAVAMMVQAQQLSQTIHQLLNQ